MRYYLIVRDGYEYDDQSHSKTQDDAYTLASNLYTDRKVAQQEANRRNKEEEDEAFSDYEGNLIHPYHVIKVDTDESGI